MFCPLNKRKQYRHMATHYSLPAGSRDLGMNGLVFRIQHPTSGSLASFEKHLFGGINSVTGHVGAC